MAMSIFVRKHWRKIILALTTAFWSSCDSDSTTNPPVECEGQECVQESSSSTETTSFSSTETPSSSSIESSSSEDIRYSSSLYGVFYSSSETPSSSSSNAALSSSSEQNKTICYKYNANDKITCDDGLTCEEKTTPIYDCTEGPCPLYGVPSSQEISYKCDNDETYTQEEFLKDHEIWSNAPLYGVFYNSSSDESASSDKKN
jgi:hypothetical protein